MTHFLRKCFAFAACALIAGIAPDALAQSFPSERITFVMPTAPGSTVETFYRILAGKAAAILGQQIIVENRVGAGGAIGVRALMNSRADGHVIGWATNAYLVTLPLSDPGFRIEPDKDYAPVILTAETPLLLAAHPSAPFRDLRGLIAYAKTNSGKLSVAAANRLSNSHLAWELVKSMTGIEITVVVYQSEPHSVPDMLNGLALATVASPTFKPHVDSGKLLAIATTGRQRWALFPSVPTLQEARLEGFAVSGFYGIIAPAGTPSAAISTLHRAFRTALGDPEIRERMQEAGLILREGSPEQYTALLKSEIVRWTPVMQKLASQTK